MNNSGRDRFPRDARIDPNRGIYAIKRDLVDGEQQVNSGYVLHVLTWLERLTIQSISQTKALWAGDIIRLIQLKNRFRTAAKTLNDLRQCNRQEEQTKRHAKRDRL